MLTAKGQRRAQRAHHCLRRAFRLRIGSARLRTVLAVSHALVWRRQLQLQHPHRPFLDVISRRPGLMFPAIRRCATSRVAYFSSEETAAAMFYGEPLTCACDTEGPTPSPTPLCQLCPTPSVSPSRCGYPASEPYTCAQDRNGCEICKCCNFEGVGGCCDFGGSQPYLYFKSRAAASGRWPLRTSGYAISGCPLPVTCNHSSGRCGYPNQ